MSSAPTIADLISAVRTALGRTATTPVPEVPGVPDHLRPALPDPTSVVSPSAAVAASDLVATFIASAQRSGAEVLAPSALATLLASLPASEIHRPGDPTHPAPFTLACTITRASAAIALSGSVLVDQDDALATMATPLLVVHVDPATIVPHLHDALARSPSAPSPTRVIVTGPSKTADIEGILITGVHGPGRVAIVLDTPSSP